MPPSYVGRRTREHLATDSVRSKLSPLSVPVSPVARGAWSEPYRCIKTSTNNWSSYEGRNGTSTGIQTKNPREGSFRRPPHAEVGADAARSRAEK